MSDFSDYSTPFDQMPQEANVKVPVFHSPPLMKEFKNLGGLMVAASARIPEKSAGAMTTSLNLLSTALRAMAKGKLANAHAAMQQHDQAWKEAMGKFRADMQTYNEIMKQHGHNWQLAQLYLKQAAADKKDRLMQESLNLRQQDAVWKRLNEMDKMHNQLDMSRERLKQAYVNQAIKMQQLLKTSEPADIHILDRINQERQAKGQEPMGMDEYLAVKEQLKQREPAETRDLQILQAVKEGKISWDDLRKLTETETKPKEEKEEKDEPAIRLNRQIEAMTPAARERFMKTYRELHPTKPVEQYPTAEEQGAAEAAAAGQKAGATKGDPKIRETITKSLKEGYTADELITYLKKHGYNPDDYKDLLKAPTK